MKNSLIAVARMKVQRSPKFQQWEPQLINLNVVSKSSDPQLALEQHYTPNEIAKAWGLSAELVRQIFETEAGVLIIDRPETRYKRGYRTMRIPENVVLRVRKKLSERY